MEFYGLNEEHDLAFDTYCLTVASTSDDRSVLMMVVLMKGNAIVDRTLHYKYRLYLDNHFARKYHNKIDNKYYGLKRYYLYDGTHFIRSISS